MKKINESNDGYWNSRGRYWVIKQFNKENNSPEIIMYPNGTKMWSLPNGYHREDGPAYEGFDGSKLWYINGERLSEQEFNLFQKLTQEFNTPKNIAFKITKLLK